MMAGISVQTISRRVLPDVPEARDSGRLRPLMITMASRTQTVTSTTLRIANTWRVSVLMSCAAEPAGSSTFG